MTRGVKLLTVILPTYNEKDNILLLIEQILTLPHSDEIKVMVVDDDSSDLTWKVVAQRYELNPAVTVLRREGKEKSLVGSLNDAIQKADTEFVLWMDADLQMPANKITDFFMAMKNNEVTAVIGSRYIPGGGDIRHMGGRGDKGVTTLHRFLSGILSKLVPALLNIFSNDGPRNCKFLKLRAYSGRSRELLQKIQGIGFNLMNQPHLSKIIYLSSVFNLRDGLAPTDAFQKAVTSICSDPFKIFLLDHSQQFLEKGLDNFTENERHDFIDKLSKFSDKAAQEITQWLNGEYNVGSDCLTD